MNELGINETRWRFLNAAMFFVASAGVAGVTTHLVKLWNPNRKAKVVRTLVLVAPSKIHHGSMITVISQGKLIWILGRTATHLGGFYREEYRGELRDTDSEINQHSGYAINDY